MRTKPSNPRIDRRLGGRRPNLPRLQRAMLETLESRRLMAFGVTTGTTPTGQPTYVIDNGGDLKFSVIRGGTLSSTIHLGDVSSIQYKNREMLAAYAVTSRYSHYEQGLSSSTVISYTVDATNGWILVKCDDSIASDDSAIQYYAVRSNDNNIYMASLPTNVNGGPGEGRFIAYLSRSVFTNPEEPSDLAGNTGAIEGGDVFGFADGTTASKFYNMGRRMIENEVHGVTGSASGTSVGAWMFMGNRERSSGGAFFKDIDFQAGSAVEIYNCIFTGHTQTEPYRQGLHTYAMQFTDGSAPATPDYSWFDDLKDAGGNLLIGGHIPADQRGAISGKATGSPAGQETVVALSNAEAQYWDMADASGNYSITGVLPGTYTETLYSNELAVGARQVTIAAGQTTRADITSTYFRPTATWRIGTWDGTPVGFLNADKIEIMHPSDARMSSWTSTPNFVVGTNSDAEWPMAQFMDVNNGQRITFNLTAGQAAAAQTLRIGITLGFEGGRNRVTVNAGQSYAWTSTIPAASRDLNSRGITRGTWRGDNQLYTYNIPTSALRAGTNTIDLPVVSGTPGTGFLSPNVVYDAIDLVPTSTLTNAPRVTTMAVTPANPNVAGNGTRQFTATARDQFGAVTPANVVWTTTNGTIDDTGLYTAPATPGSATVTATSGTVSGSTNVNIVTAQAPTVATAAVATPNPVSGTTTNLSVLGADDGGEAALTYAWSATGPAAVTYSATNGTNAAKNTTATFSAAGAYTFTATITDGGGLTTTSNVNVTVNQTLTSIVVTPATTTVAPSGTQQFTAAAKDQFGTNLATQPTFTWTVATGGGTVDAGGLYTAPATAGSATVRASAAAVLGDASVATVVPRAWWKLDESSGVAAADSSGNANHGTAAGGPGWVAGKFGNAMSFDGVDDLVTLPNSIANSAAGSVSMWIRTGTNFADSAHLFYASSSTVGNGGGAENELHLNFLSDERIQFFIEGGTADVSVISASSYADSAWHHVAATWDINGNAVLYVDGAQVGSVVHNAANFTGSARTHLGRPAASLRYYNGLMDDVRLYNVALSPSHVQAVYNEVPTGSISGQSFHDKNGDGAFGAGDTLISGATVFLDADGDGDLDLGETSTITDASGAYSFANVTAGTYVVRQVAPSEFAVANSNTAIVSAGGASTNNNFANARIVYNGAAGVDNYGLRKNASGKYEILIDGSLAYTVFAAAPSLTFNLGSGDDVLTLDFANGAPVPAGTMNFDGGAGNDEVSIVTAAAAETLDFNAAAVTIIGVAGNVTHANLEAVRFDGNGGWDTVTVNAGPAVTFADAQQLQSLALSGSGVARFAVGAAATVARSLALFDAAKLDLADTTLIIDTTDPNAAGAWNGETYTGLLGHVASGFNYGAWDGSGIITSQPGALNGATTVAVATGEQILGLGPTDTDSFAGQTVSGRSVILKYTYAGDANLDGQIDAGDYGILDAFIQIEGSSGYANGDFNFDGFIDAGDYGTIDNGVQVQGPPL